MYNYVCIDNIVTKYSIVIIEYKKQIRNEGRTYHLHPAHNLPNLPNSFTSACRCQFIPINNYIMAASTVAYIDKWTSWRKEFLL